MSVAAGDGDVHVGGGGGGFILSSDLEWLKAGLLLSFLLSHSREGCVSLRGGGCFTEYLIAIKQLFPLGLRWDGDLQQPTPGSRFTHQQTQNHFTSANVAQNISLCCSSKSLLYWGFFLLQRIKKKRLVSSKQGSQTPQLQTLNPLNHFDYAEKNP